MALLSPPGTQTETSHAYRLYDYVRYLDACLPVRHDTECVPSSSVWEVEIRLRRFLLFCFFLQCNTTTLGVLCNSWWRDWEINLLLGGISIRNGRQLRLQHYWTVQTLKLDSSWNQSTVVEVEVHEREVHSHVLAPSICQTQINHYALEFWFWFGCILFNFQPNIGWTFDTTMIFNPIL